MLDSDSSNEIKKVVCSILVEHARFKLTNEPDVYKQYYFACTANDAHIKLNKGKFDPEWAEIAQRHAALIQKDFDPQKALEAGLALAKVEIPNDKQPEKFEKLKTYSLKFFAKANCEKTWGSYPNEKLPLTKQGHDVRFVKFTNTELELAERFSSKLEKHGFTAQIQKTDKSLFLSTDLSLAKPKF